VTRSLLVLPVRLTLAGRSVQTTTRSVTPEAIYIRSVAPPPVGMAVSLRLYLSDGPPEDLHGHVVPTPVGAEQGCLVALAAVTPDQRERLELAITPPVLQRRDSQPLLSALGAVWPGRGDSAPMLAAVSHPHAPGPGAGDSSPTLTAFDLRALPRFPVQLKVRFETVEALEDQLAINLSSGGMFVRCAEPAPLGTEVRLVIELPGLVPPLICRAVVAHRVVQEQARTTGQVAGVGVQFLDADDRFRDAVDRYIAQVRAQHGR
jgi:uncharacterized protein (TIGR02266 family)